MQNYSNPRCVSWDFSALCESITLVFRDWLFIGHAENFAIIMHMDGVRVYAWICMLEQSAGECVLQPTVARLM